MLYIWTQNYPQIVGTCPGHPGQLISQKSGLNPPPPLQGLTWAMLYIWTQNYPQIVGTCPGHPGQLISQKSGLNPPPPPPRPHMGNVVHMDSKLPSNCWYLSWPSWPTHISKIRVEPPPPPPLQGLTWAMLYIWTQNYPQIVGTCPGHPGQLISQKSGLNPPPPPSKASHGQCCTYGLKTTLKLLVLVLAILANS